MYKLRLVIVSIIVTLVVAMSGCGNSEPQILTLSSPSPLCISDTMPGPLTAQPDATNTGVPVGETLTTISGDYHTKKDGEVVANKNITGRLYIDHANVIVKCTQVLRMTTVLKTGAKLWNVNLGDRKGSGEGSAIKTSNYTLRRANVVGTLDGLKIDGNVDVQDSFIHNMFYQKDSTQPGGYSHNDGMQMGKGSNVLVKHNTFYMWSFKAGQVPEVNDGKTPYGDGAGYMTSAILIKGQNCAYDISNVTIEDNLFRGRAAKYIYVLCRTSGVKIINNKWGRESRDYPLLIAKDPKYPATITGNTYFDNGQSDNT